MQIFEFLFNPPGQSKLAARQAKDLIFDSFCYEPENVYEKRLGSLFLVGEIKNALPQNLKFLDNFVSHFKKEYYSSPVKFSPEAALKLGLKKSNEFLEGVAKAGDVSWLGNLNLAILSFKNFDLNLTKVGAIKILLLRQGQVIDIGKNLEFEDIEPYPLKIFSNIVAGKLAEKDIILVLTKDVFSAFAEGCGGSAVARLKTGKGGDFFQPDSLLQRIANLAPFDEKRLKAILKTREKELLKISGVCLLLFLTKEVWTKTERQRAFTFQAEAEKFSFKKAFSPFVNPLKKILPFKNLLALTRAKLASLNGISKFAGLRQKFSNGTKVKIAPRQFLNRLIKIKRTAHPQNWRESPVFRKNAVLVLSLILFIILGFFIFKGEEQAKLKKIQSALTDIRENMSQAENYLALSNEKNGFLIYKKAWQDILPISKEKSALQEEAISLKNSIQKNLEKISKLETVSDPNLFFKFDEKEFIPQKMVFFKDNLYLFSPFCENVYKLSPAKEQNVLLTGQRFNEAVSFDNQILFFQKPNLIFFLKDDNWSEPISLSLPYSDFNPKTLAIYRSSLYFLDEKNGEIVKYPAPLKQNKDFPQIWLSAGTKKAIGSASMTIDGSIWILNPIRSAASNGASKDNAISQYFNGNLKKTLTLDLFPEPENLSSITALSELFYVLEPAQKRIIVLTKTGEAVKQFQSEKFDNLKDFAVSNDGKKIWLLNGMKIYEIEIKI